VDNGAKLLSQLININLRGRIQQNMTSQQRESEMVITITPVICSEANQSDSRMETANSHENLELCVDLDADVDMESSDSEMEQYSNSHPNKIVTPTSLQTHLSQMADPEPMDCDQNSSNFGLITIPTKQHTRSRGDVNKYPHPRACRYSLRRLY